MPTGMRPCLGLLLLLLGWGTAWDSSFSNESTEGEQWPTLKILKNLPFSCNPKILASNSSSISVNALRPSDVKFVASIGIKETGLEDSSFSGGSAKYSCIIRNKLTASSNNSVMEKLNWTEKTSQEICLGVGKDIIRYFDTVVTRLECTPMKEVTSDSGAEYLLTQATELVRNMKENPQLDFENDWKLINVFIGNANECYLCPIARQESFVISAMSKLAKTLDYLQQEVPRAFVNLVDLSGVLDSFALTRTQDSKNSESCECSEEIILSKDMVRWSYQETWEKVLAFSKYNQKESFALVLQPFFYETDWSSHLGAPWYQEASKALMPQEKPLQDSTALGVHLWNSMMEPAGQKERPYSDKEEWLVKCPTEDHPYLFTYNNSNYKPRLMMNYPAFKAKALSFDCPDKTPSRTIPQSVHQLKPADIKIVTAVGDSLMATSGIRSGSNKGALTFYEGLSWSVGGDENLRSIITLPNILRKFNSKLRSYSPGHGNSYISGSRLQSVAGVSSMYLPDQVTELIKKIKSDTRTNYKKDWKLLTMFVGRNDLCHSCTKELIFDLEKSRNNIQHALDILHEEVPRMIVNMVLPIEITSLRALHKEMGNKCPQDQLIKSCPCVMKYGEGSEEYAKLTVYNKKYQKLVKHMVESGRYDTRDDFTVVLQPFFEKFEMPRTKEWLPDLTYFAPDCFHFSQKMLGHIASALWNNMLEPVGQKSRHHDFTRQIVLSCPTQGQPFLMTSKNNQENFRIIGQCKDKSPSPSKPNSVHSLKPADIDAVAALGDGTIIARGVLGDGDKHYRGRSFSTGADGALSSFTSLANILRLYNKNLKGMSSGHGEYYSSNAGLNMGRTGIHSGKLLTQAVNLVTFMRNYTSLNFAQDWKVITIMIGNEEICYSCYNPQLYSVTNYKFNIRKALDYLHDKVPRALVNLMYFVDPKLYRAVYKANTATCTYDAGTTCECALRPKKGSIELTIFDEMIHKYQNALSDLLADGRYDTREDFTVVLQPIGYKAKLPVGEDGSIPVNFLSKSCENLGLRVQEALGAGLWNNMFEKIDEKTALLDLRADITVKCPGEIESQELPLLSEYHLVQIWRSLNTSMVAFVVPITHPGFIKTYKNSEDMYPQTIVEQNWGNDLQCNTRLKSKEEPTSAHALRPSDIKVVAAMGDWITTAFGASPENRTSYTDWPGLSWSIGGDKTLRKQVTLPNILRRFNLRVQGYSRGAEDDFTGLNVARLDARARDLPEQANRLLSQMQSISSINFNEDWKVITILIGINDLCDFCTKKPEPIVALQNYAGKIAEAIGILAEKIPKVFVNLVEPMEVISLYDNQGKNCSLQNISCPCFRTTDSQNKSALHFMNMEFQNAINEVTAEFSTRDQEDFVVVTQPFFRRSKFPLDYDGVTDPSYFSLDCFHFSSLAQNEIAIALWNNMLEPVGLKSTEHDFRYHRKKLRCPSILYPYFFTAKNSHTHWVIWIVPVLAVCLFLFGWCCILYCRRRAAANLNLWKQPEDQETAKAQKKP